MSQQKRKVKVYRSSSGSLSNYESDAVFFGQLRNELKLDPERETITVQETKVTLLHDEAQLPEGDFLIFVSQKKSKSGATIVNSKGVSIEMIPAENLESSNYNTLRSYCSQLTGTAPSKKDEIIKSILDYYRASSKTPQKEAKKKEEVTSKKAEIIHKDKEAGISFSPEIEKKLDNISKALFAIATGLNVFIESEGESPIDVSFLLQDVNSMPVEHKNVVTLSPEEKARIEEQKEKERLAKEAKALGL